MAEPTGLEPHPPKLPSRPPSVEDAPDVVEAADGWAELDGVSISGDTDLSACTEVEAVDCVFDGVVLGGPDADLTLELTRCEVSGSDLSQVRIHAVQTTRFVDCKLTGADLSGVRVRDVEFVRCTLRYANLRLATLERVRFSDCTLDDVDCYEATLTDVAFPGTALRGLNVDRTTFERVDLADATELGLTAVGSLRGVTVAEHQIIDLAWTLAAAVGLTLR